MNIVLFIIPAIGLLGLVVTAFKSSWVTKQDAGEPKMQELASFIARGAMAFLKAEWRILGVFALIAAVLLGWSGTLIEESSPIIAVSFIIGALLSGTHGF
ncbi:MAG TPA: sodium-translocating pyrophosphatase, partial [Cytophagales bacterium]|nr:sodium-translocating pyrophosphatase [Cytophagales bacterium]